MTHHIHTNRLLKYELTTETILGRKLFIYIDFLGVFFHHQINYWKEVGESEAMSIYRPLGGQRDHGLIIGLDSHTYYFVNVQVFNSAGNGPKSQDYLEETLRSRRFLVFVVVTDGM